MTRRRLFVGGIEREADVRPTLLGVVTLLFLLLFFLLSTSTGQRLAAVHLRLGAPEDLAPLPHHGLVKEVRVALRSGAATVEIDVQTTDISASSVAVERRAIAVPALAGGEVDLVGLAEAVERVHGVDPTQDGVRLDPDDATTVESLLRVMDVLRGPAHSPRLTRVVLDGAAR